MKSLFLSSSGYALEYSDTTTSATWRIQTSSIPSLERYLLALLMSLLRMYPCPILAGTTPSPRMNVAALRWSATILNARVVSSSDPYLLPVISSIFPMMPVKRGVS